ncbi:uncharacterized protein AMSG_12183 [Thecamonas trahens ATCC 50062]|uniref:Uncharacterized protein n=1 Tax=Thecamonas trahens ATCC 50062 TaxID=461836 RepID=A0A0L0DKH1_THETB|nr:hypothetical protein AMSG_12183 [Thecamonas trahens ATCC 50062]KNC52710.1 hypothetical protein AMSG_12183 [Thecamonas trahens ATCC 50062]|eukprot:XP_013755125.1 hypothetical protein AMSG_12183 [Thecamonas trahens ATCC 50062]
MRKCFFPMSDYTYDMLSEAESLGSEALSLGSSAGSEALSLGSEVAAGGGEGLRVGKHALRAGKVAFISKANDVKDYLESEAVQDKADVAWAESAAAYDVGKKNLIKMVEGVGAATSSFGNFDFAVKFDLFRDFFQIIGLFFAGIEWPDSFREFFGSIFRVFSLTLPDLITVEPSVVQNIWFWFLFLFSISLFSTIVRARVTTDDIREGLEARHWVDSSKRKRLTVQIVLTILTTLFMPCTEVALRIMVCDSEWITAFDSCYSVQHIMYIVAAVVMFVIISIGLPVACYLLIQSYKPIPRIYNAEGHRVPYALRKTVYRNELRRDKTPYSFLYYGYERSWAHYKVIIMGVKLMLAVLIITLSRNNAIYEGQSRALQVIQISGVLLVMVVFAAVAFRISPFLLRENDLIDRCGRVTSVLTAFIGFILVFDVWDESNWGIVLNVLHVLNLLFMALLFFTGVSFFAKCCKNTFKMLTFTPDPRKPSRDLFFSPSLNLLTARKQRIWHEFWDGLFMVHDEFKPPESQKWAFAQPSVTNTKRAIREASDSYSSTSESDGRAARPASASLFADAAAKQSDITAADTAPYLQNFQGTVGERHFENKRIVEVVGFHAYEHAVLDSNSDSALQIQHDVLKYIVGLDVYYEGMPEDGELDSFTCFGRAYALPFPFTVVMVYDDDDDHVFLREQARLREFIDQNRFSEIMRRRYLRTRIRALDGKIVYFFHKARIQKWKEERRGSTTKRFKVFVDFKFRRGKLRITGYKRKNPFQTSDGAILNMSEGFGFTIAYQDGEGDDDAGGHWTDEPLLLRDTDFGHNKRNEFEETKKIQRLLYHVDNQAIWKPRHKKVLRAFHDYRRHWLNEFRHKASTLSYEFHYHIYNSSYVPYKNLVAYLRNYEQNELLRTLPERHATGLRLLYERLRFFDAHPGNAVWFVFWHDLWANNSSFSAFEEADEYLNPANPTAIAYHPLDQEDLEYLLREIGVWSYFSRRLMDKLYARMEEIVDADDPHPALLAPRDFHRSKLVDSLDVSDIDSEPSLGSSFTSGSDEYTFASASYSDSS